MDAPVYKKLSDIESTRENPFQTKFGQDVVSIEESFESRLYRQGRPISSYINGSTLAAGAQSTIGSVNPSPGCELIPLYITLSADQDVVLNIQYNTKFALNQINKAASDTSGNVYEVAFIKAGTPYCRRLNGEIRIYESGGVNLIVNNNTASSAKVYSSIYGIEVTTNA